MPKLYRMYSIQPTENDVSISKNGITQTIKTVVTTKSVLFDDLEDAVEVFFKHFNGSIIVQVEEIEHEEIQNNSIRRG